MSSSVEKIKERLNIADLVGLYVKLERAGGSLKAKCPFHNEKTPSFFVSPERGSYYCFGCGAKGDIFTFVQEFEGLDFIGALKVLAERAGVKLEKERPELRDEKNRVYEIMEQSALFYQKRLTENKEAMSYLRKRGITTESFKKWRLGFAPKEWQGLYNFLKAKKWNDKDIEIAGLSKRGERGHYDRFISRIIFPLFDSSGRVIAFSGRIFGEEENEKIPKYLNSPETPIFTKSNVFYGFDKAKFDIRKKDQAIFVEGQVDLIMAHQAGFTNTVGVSGTALTDSLSSENQDVANNFGVIKRLTNNIVFCFDSDNAGVKASERSSKIALAMGLDVKIAKLPDGLDPADIILKDKSVFEKAIKNAKHIIDFLSDIILEKGEEKRKTGKMISEKLIPLVVSIESNIEKSNFINTIAKKFGYDEKILWEELKISSRRMKNDRPLSQSEEIKNLDKEEFVRMSEIESKICGLILWLEKRGDDTEIMSYLSEEVGEEFLKEIKRRYEKDREALIFEAESNYEDRKSLKKRAEELVLNLKEEEIKKEFTKCMSELALSESKKDKKKSEEIMSRLKKLTEELGKIRKKLKK